MQRHLLAFYKVAKWRDNAPLSLLVPIYTPGWRKVLRVKCVAQEHNTNIPSWGLNPETAQSGGEHTNQ